MMLLRPMISIRFFSLGTASQLITSRATSKLSVAYMATSSFIWLSRTMKIMVHRRLSPITTVTLAKARIMMTTAVKERLILMMRPEGTNNG
jgi:hypothetical protein